MWQKLPNGGIERQIRRYLKEQGYRLSRYELRDIELVAVERPGWKQIFRFDLNTQNESGHSVALIGIAYDDHRSHCKIKLLATEAQYQTQLSEWGAGMILRRQSQNEFQPGCAVVIVFVLLGLLTLIFSRTTPPARSTVSPDSFPSLQVQHADMRKPFCDI